MPASLTHDASGPRLTQPVTPPGTYLYMAPEMIRHEAYDQRADVYSWGVLLAEVLNQRPPYEELFLTPVQACPVGFACAL